MAESCLFRSSGFGMQAPWGGIKVNHAEIRYHSALH
jgi:hypothetical protein